MQWNEISNDKLYIFKGKVLMKLKWQNSRHQNLQKKVCLQMSKFPCPYFCTYLIKTKCYLNCLVWRGHFGLYIEWDLRYPTTSNGIFYVRKWNVRNSFSLTLLVACISHIFMKISTLTKKIPNCIFNEWLPFLQFKYWIEDFVS